MGTSEDDFGKTALCPFEFAEFNFTSFNWLPLTKTVSSIMLPVHGYLFSRSVGGARSGQSCGDGLTKECWFYFCTFFFFDSLPLDALRTLNMQKPRILITSKRCRSRQKRVKKKSGITTAWCSSAGSKGVAVPESSLLAAREILVSALFEDVVM